MDDAPYKAVIAKLESFTMELCECFPVLNSAAGTLSINISFPGITVYVYDICKG